MNNGYRMYPSGHSVTARLLRHSLVRYLLSGVVNTMVGLSVSLFALHGFGFAYWPATLCGFLAGWTVGFVLSRHYTFRNRHSDRLPLRMTLPKYAGTVLAAYVLSAWLGAEAARWVGQWVGQLASFGEWSFLRSRKDLAVLLCNGCYIVFNYAGQRWFVFRK